MPARLPSTLKSYAGTTYRAVYAPDHPHATKRKQVLEHRLVMEAHLGRLLDPGEVVHHRDHNGLNNQIDNLELIASKGAHLAEHHSADGVAARMAGYPTCACGRRTAYNQTQCWDCWAASNTCPTCGRPDRKMATRTHCHGCYKALRVVEGRFHRKAKPD